MWCGYTTVCFAGELSLCQSKKHFKAQGSSFCGLAEIKTRPDRAVKMWPYVQGSQPQQKKAHVNAAWSAAEYSLPLPEPVPNARHHRRPPCGLHQPVHHLQDGGCNCMRMCSLEAWGHTSHRTVEPSHTRSRTHAVMWRRWNSCDAVWKKPDPVTLRRVQRGMRRSKVCVLTGWDRTVQA